MSTFDTMAKELAERNRRGRRMYAILIPFAIAALIGALALRVIMGRNVREAQMDADVRSQ